MVAGVKTIMREEVILMSILLFIASNFSISYAYIFVFLMLKGITGFYKVSDHRIRWE